MFKYLILLRRYWVWCINNDFGILKKIKKRRYSVSLADLENQNKIYVMDFSSTSFMPSFAPLLFLPFTSPSSLLLSLALEPKVI